MKSTEVRSTFLNYFKKNGHTIVPSSSLIPENDPTLLFANAGMNQFKNAFLGLEKRGYVRATSVQNCVRAGGKHNDLENVGFTARHHTYFEMLGNFSFGDYFKKDAIHFAWELLTREYKIPKDKLYVTVFENDDEAADLWHKQENIPRDRIFRFGEKDNFWRMGETGPCGPCSEIFYDHGPLPGLLEDPFQGIAAGQDRFVEIWNLVFMQFDEVSPGKLVHLPKPSVDTGAGFERMTAALQGKINNYDTDLFFYLVERAAEIAKLDLGRIFKNSANDGTSPLEQLAALRVLADHTRASSMLLADGVLPSNEGRGYVLRRIIRRALRFGRKLNPNESFLPRLAETFIQNFSSINPQLAAGKKDVLQMLSDEESKFLTTLDTGTEILEREMKALGPAKALPGELVFKLYDTFGFPVDLTELMAREQGFAIDASDFERRMKESQTLARQSWKGKSSFGTNETHQLQLIQHHSPPTVFRGYDQLEVSTKIVGLSDGEREVAELAEGQAGLMIVAETPFYAESGGQVGDRGHGKTTSAQFQISDAQKKQNVFLHFVSVTSGKIKVGDQVDLLVATPERRETAAHHSATHLLHAALRQILGTGVKQAGSLVRSQRLRFDFTYPRPISAQELAEIENLVNDVIAQDEDAQIHEMNYPDAIKLGALALFGEKYGDRVRVLKIGDFSTELCGGTHVSRTAQIRLFKIISQSSVASGVRRIEAVVSKAAFDYLNRLASDDLAVRESLNLNDPEVATVLKIDALKKQLSDLQKELQKAKISQVDVVSLRKNIREATILGMKTPLLFEAVDATTRDELLALHDQLKSSNADTVLILVARQTPHLCLVSAPPKGALKAGEIFKLLTQTFGGKGGGRPDLAQGSLDRLPALNEFIG